MGAVVGVGPHTLLLRPLDELTHGLSPIATKSGGRAELFLVVISIFMLKTFRVMGVACSKLLLGTRRVSAEGVLGTV